MLSQSFVFEVLFSNNCAIATICLPAYTDIFMHEFEGKCNNPINPFFSYNLQTIFLWYGQSSKKNYAISGI